MMTGMISRAWQSVKPHVPLIKFRKGGSGQADKVIRETATPAASEGSKKGAPSLKTTTLPIIEDWQLPARYRRSQLDDKEIDMINSGGAY